MIIDKLGNKTYEPSEITYIAQLEIRSVLSQAQEDNLQRKLIGSLVGAYTLSADEQQEVDDYKSMLLAVQTEAAQAVIDNQLLIDAIAYEQAIVRLQQHPLAVGRSEQAVYKTDNLGNETLDYIIPSVSPLPATIEKIVYSADGMTHTTQMVANPQIEIDEAERAAAQAIIDGVSDEVLALVAQREDHSNGLSAN